MADARGYSAGKFVLVVDGTPAGLCSSVEGGHATSDVIQEKAGGELTAFKHIGGVKYEDITVNVGAAISDGFGKWIQASFGKKHERKNGNILSADFDSKGRAGMDFFNALVTELGFPALDASSKDAAKMTVKFSPEYTRFKKGSGDASAAISPPKQKMWTPANFRLKIDGLEEGCAKVNKIEALTLKQKVVENPVGEMRDYQKEPVGLLDVPNLVVTLPESHADKWYEYHESFVIKGENGQDKEKGATLTYLTPDLKTEVLTLTFKQLGIFKLTPDKLDAGSEQIRRVKAEFYCESLEFKFSGSAVG